MGTRTVTAKLADWNNVEPSDGEPCLLLTARDINAAAAIDVYASLCGDYSDELKAKIRALAEQMRKWREAHR